MLYEQYRLKIAKVADVLATLRRFRVLIICVCAFIAVLTATLLSLSGTVYDAAECPASIVAGEEFPYRAGAVFNGVEYEFSVNGSNIWTAEIPSRPGEYLVRPVSKDIAGKPRYGKTHLFTVVPRTITVTADCTSAVYGDIPPVKADLLYSDEVTCSEFTYSDYSSSETVIEPVKDAVTVYDENGNDVTYTYNIQTQSSQLNFIKREISVSLSPYEADYDGKEHPKIPYTGYKISGETPLAEGDFEEVYVRVFQTQAGEYSNEIYFKIYKRTEAGSVEVTSNYNINVSSGTLTVNKRTLEITTADLTAVYDGIEKYENGFTLSESSLLALNDAGHSISVTGNTVEKNAGEYENELKFTVTDADGKDVSSNYTFSCTYGTLKILPRPLTCTTNSAEWYYDGITHSDNTGFVILKNSSSSYASEDEVAYFVEGSEMHVRDVKDSCENKIEIGIYNNATGEDVTDNYAINYVYGTLTVIPRPITVKVEGEEWEYDGETHSSSKHSITYDKDLVDFALIEGHSVTARGLKSITDIGSVQNGIDFGIYEGDAIVTDNYGITWQNGDITVTPRKIIVGAKSYEKIYDGTPLTSGGVEVVSQTKLVKGHSITAETEGIVVNAESVTCSITDKSTITVFDANGADVSKNYEIENITNGTLTVKQREITVTAGTAHKVYDGTPLTCGTYSVTSEFEKPLVEGHELTVTTSGSVTEATDEVNSIAACKIMWSKTDVTGNYDIRYKTGLLTVFKRRATIVTASTDNGINKLIYNASPQSLEKFEELCEDNIDTGILKAHSVYIVKSFYITDVSAKPYENDLVLGVKAGERDVTQNYEITVIKGSIAVSPLHITVITEDGNFDYNALPHSYGGHRVSEETPLAHDSHKTVASDLATVTDVCKDNEQPVENTMKISVVDGNGADISHNYAITVLAEGRLTVNKCSITVTSSDAEFIYNARPQSSDAHSVTEGSLALNTHKTVASDLATVTNVRRDGEGLVYNTMKISVKDKDGNDISHNYAITVIETGVLTVNPRPIKVKTASTSWTFDGDPHSDCAIELTEGTLIDELPYGHTFAYSGMVPQITFFGEVGNEFDFYVADAGGQNISYNYSMDCEYGKLSITALPITVTANSDKKVYDATALINDGFDITAENKYAAQLKSVKEKYRFEATVVGSATNVDDAGVNEVSNLAVYDDKNQPVGLDNFEISYVKGKLTIDPRKITVRPDDAPKTYDGTPLSCDTYKITEGELVDGQTLTVVITVAKTDEGVYDNEIDGYTVTDKTVGDVTRNYSVTELKGTLTIFKRKITVKADSDEKIYDGKELVCKTWAITDGELADNQELSVTINSSATDAGIHDNLIYSYTVTDKTVGDVTHNYEVTTIKGTLTIFERVLKVNTSDKTDFIYNGEPQSWLEFTYENLVTDQNIEADKSKPYAKLTDIGEAQNEFTVKITSGVKDVSSNYSVEYNYGKIEVKPRPVYVYAVNSTKVYDGTADISADNKCFDAVYNGDDGAQFGIVQGHKIYSDIIGAEEPIGANVGEYSIKICGDTVIKDGNRDVSKNYQITPVAQLNRAYAILSVTQRPISVITYDGVKEEYDGYELTNKAFDVTNLVTGHIATIDVTGTRTDAGESPNTFNEDSLKVMSGETDVTRNYTIVESTLGTLTVKPRPVYVTTESDSKIYDGKPLINTAYTAENLLEGLNAQITVTGSQTLVGESYNTVDEENFTVTDANGSEVNKDNYYLVISSYGMLTVTGKLTVRTASDEKIYDGIPLTNPYYEIIESAIPEGYNAVIEVNGSQTDAGIGDNYFNWNVYTENGEEVSVFFEVTSDIGDLTVHKRPITVTTGSASKIYDGTPLRYNKADITEGTLADGHKADIYVYGEIIEVGVENNEFQIDIFDANEKAVVKNYSITADFGLLTVTENTEAPDNDKVWIRARSDIGGAIYLREISYGDYLNGMSWANATPYESTIEYNGAEYGYNYLTSFALGNSSNVGKVDVELTYKTYLLPYYAQTDGNHVIQTSDTIYSGDTAKYSVNYIKYDYLASGSPNTVNPYLGQEAQYSRFVKENYLNVDDQTRVYLESIIRENKLSKDDISGVVEYIKGSATYDLERDYTSLESNENVIISFLRDSEYGVCRHFAMAGTMLFRVLGIPARYTVGFAQNLKAGEWADFTSGHAWVELYIDGLGWVMVEVTPPASMSGGGSDIGDGEGNEGEGEGGLRTYNITLKPKDAVKTYDGTAITATDIEPDLTLVRLLELGYYYEDIVFEGSQTEVGESQSTVSGFTLFTPEGAVFDDVKYTYKKGLLKVVKEEVVTIHTYSKLKEYDGAPMYFKSHEYYASFGSGAQGYRAEVTGLEKVGFTDAGILTADVFKDLITVKIYDGQGEDVTANFYIDYDPDYMITKCVITISTNNVSKEYDETELVDEGDPKLTFGSLVSGHRIKVISRPSITEVGETINRIVYQIVDKNGEDVSRNYDVTENFGKLTVTEGD